MKTKQTIITFLILLSSSLVAQTWQPVQPNITSPGLSTFVNSVGSYGPVKAAINSNGEAFKLYQNSSNFSFIDKFNGTTWIPFASLNHGNFSGPYFDHSGNVYVIGGDLKKYDSNGNYLGIIGSLSFGGADNIVKFDQNDLPYVCSVGGYSVGYSATVRKFDGTNWAILGGASVSTDELYNVSFDLDGTGTPYVAFSNNSNNKRASVLKFDGVNWINVGPEFISPGASTHTVLSIDANNVPYIAYNDVSSNSFIAKRFTSNAWTNVGPEILTSNDAYHTSSIMFGSDNLPVIAYSDGSAKDRLTVRKYDGSNWNLLGEQGFSSGRASYIDLFIDNSGSYHITYNDQFNGQRRTIRKFDGATWVDIMPEGFSRGSATSLSIDATGSGTPYVCYIDLDDKAIFVKKNDGTSWADVNSAGITSNQVASSVLELDNNEIPHIAYFDLTLGKTLVKKFDGSSWVEVGSTGSLISGYPTDIVFDANNNLYLARYSSAIPTVGLVDKFDGANWTSLGGSNISTNLMWQIKIAIEPYTGVPHIVYKDYGYGATVKKFDGTNWILVGPRFLSAGEIDFPSIAFASNGALYIAYQDAAFGGKATVKKLTSNSWTTVGVNGFTPGKATGAYLYIDGNDRPFLSYMDGYNDDKASIMLFNGFYWNSIGGVGLTYSPLTATEYLPMVIGGNNLYLFCSVSKYASVWKYSSCSSVVTANFQSPNLTTCPGATTTLSIKAVGTGLQHQWQVDQGSGFTNLSNNAVYSGVKTCSLSIMINAGLHGYKYRYFSTQCGTSDTTAATTLNVLTAATLTGQPVNQTICETQNASFSITTSAGSGFYNWEISSGSGFTQINDGGVYSGATTKTLNITSPTALLNNMQYRCRIRNSCGGNFYSNVAYLFVNPGSASPATITSQPLSKLGCVGSPVNYLVTTSGTTSGLLYQWQMDNGSGFSDLAASATYLGVNTSALTISSVTAGMNGYQFRCVISKSCGPSVTSNSASLTITTGTSITSEPVNNSICIGGNSNFSVTAIGVNLIYSWQVNTGSGFLNLSNSSTYSGVNTSTLSISNGIAGMNGYLYRCVVLGCASGDTSVTAMLSVNATPSIITQPTTTTICSGSNTSFAVGAAGSGLTYQWQISTGGAFTNLSNSGTYAGVTSNSLNITGAISGMNGFQYKCLITNACNLTTNSNTATLIIGSSTLNLTSNPSPQSVCQGANTSFTIAVSGSGGTYQWQVDQGSGFNNISESAIYSGTKTTSLNITNVNLSQNNYSFRCVVSSTCASPINSSGALLTVGAGTVPTITTQPTNQTGCAWSTIIFNTVVSGVGLSYQWQVDNGSGFSNVSNFYPYSGGTTSTLSITADPALNANLYRCVITNACLANTYSNSALLDIQQTFITIPLQPVAKTVCEGSFASFTISATGGGLSFQWQVNPGTGFVNIANSSMYAGTTTTTLSISSPTASMNMYTYRCMVSNSCAPSLYSNVVMLNVDPAPQITGDPRDTSLCVGAWMYFSVNATGSSLKYQWQIDKGLGFMDAASDLNFTGVNAYAMQMNNSIIDFNGYLFRCVVTSSCSTVVSKAALLTLSNPPTVTATISTPNTVCAGTPVLFKGYGANSYSWNYGIIDDVPFVPTLPAVTYQVTGTNNLNCSNTATVTLYVTPAVSISTQPLDKSICLGSNTNFLVGASGTGNNFQWQVNSGSGYSTISDNSLYSTSSSSLLSITQPVDSMNGYLYRCVVSNVCSSDTSLSASLSVHSIPQVSITCTSDTICSGEQVTLAGDGALIYVWNNGVIDGVPFSPTATATYTVNGQDVNACENISSKEIVVNICTSVIEEQKKFEVNVSPNPSSKSISLLVSNNEKYIELYIYDSKGHKVFASDSFTNFLEVDISKFTNGLYQLAFINKNEIVHVEKIIKQ